MFLSAEIHRLEPVEFIKDRLLSSKQKQLNLFIMIKFALYARRFENKAKRNLDYSRLCDLQLINLFESFLAKT